MEQMTKAIIGGIALIPFGIILILVGYAVFAPLGLLFLSTTFTLVASGIVVLIVGIFVIGLVVYSKITGKELPKLTKAK